MPKSNNSTNKRAAKLELQQFKAQLAQLPDSLPKPNLSWEQMPQHQQEQLILKALELVLYNKPLPQQIYSTLPPKLAKTLSELIHNQQGDTQLGRLRKLPERLQALVDRLQERGLLDKPKRSNPLDQLDPTQRQRQLAAEALELRRQNATQMLNAQQLLQRELRT